jgi:hypothetical protein
MEELLSSYRQIIIDNFSTINVGDAVLFFRNEVYDGFNRNLTFIFDDAPTQKKINLHVVVTANFRKAETIECFVDKLGKIIDKSKSNQLKQDCMYIVPIATRGEGLTIFNDYKGKFEDEEVFCLS